MMSLLSLFKNSQPQSKNLLLLGADDFFNDLLAESYLRKPQFKVLERVTVDCENEGMDELLASLSESSLFTRQKLIIIKNPFFLTSKVPKKYQKQIKQLEQIMAHVSSLDDFLLIEASYEKIDRRKKLTKQITTDFNVVETKVKPYQTPQVIQAFIEDTGGKINHAALLLLQQRSDSVLDTALANAQKLLAIAGEQEISAELVKNNIEPTLAQNIFMVLEQALAHNYGQALARLHDQIHQGNNPAQLLAIFASQAELLLVVKLLAQRGRSQPDIARELGIHPYRVKLALQNRSNVKDLKRLLAGIINDDYDFKRGKINNSDFLDLLLLSC